jgi:3-keto-disaccharide hydrolase
MFISGRIVRIVGIAIALSQLAPAAWVNLLNGKNLDGWDVVGEGFWNVLSDGTVVGQRDLSKPTEHQCWLYTKKEFGDYDLHLEYWLRRGGNSGVSIRDTSRANYAQGKNWDPKRTPSHIGYEIQIANDGDDYPTGSVYLFAKAKNGVQHDFDWNSLDIQSRNNIIRVSLNGQQVAESPGDPARSKTGPIGLQLHDHKTLAMFRNIRIQEITGK